MEWLLQYYNELNLGESIQSAYMMWKLEQHRLTPKYDIMNLLMTPVKHYFVNMEEDDNKLTITCQHCNGL